MKDLLVKGVLWLGLTRAITNILSLVSIFVLARYLTPEEFGLVAIATTIVGVVSSVTEIPISISLVSISNLNKKHYDTAFTMNLMRGAIIFIVMLIVGAFCYDSHSDNRLSFILSALGASVFIGSFSNPRIIELTKKLIFHQDFLIGSSQKLVGALVSITIAILYKSYIAIVAGVVVSSLIGVLVSYYVVAYKPSFSFRYFREIFNFSAWLTLSQIINTINWKIDHFLIGIRLGPTALGYYTVGDRLAVLPTQEISSPIEQALLPGIRSAIDSGSKGKVRETYLRAQGITFFVVFPLGIFFSLNADLLVNLILGDKWVEAALIVKILSLIFAIQTVSSLVRPLAMAYGLTKVFFKRDVLLFLIRVPLIVGAVYFIGINGVLYVRCFTGVLSMLINMSLVKSITGMSVGVQTKGLLRCVFSASVAVIILMSTINLFDEFEVQAFKAVCMFVLYIVAYVFISFLGWRILGRPPAPEGDIIFYVSKILRASKSQ